MMKSKSKSPVVITFSDFRRNVGRVLRRVEAGWEVVITSKGKPAMVMVPWNKYLTRHPEARDHIMDRALDEISGELKQQGVTLKSLMESGREVRGQLLKE